MTKCTYDELSALTDDVDYHRALEHLFVLTSAAAMPEPQRRAPVAIAAAVVATNWRTWAERPGRWAARVPGSTAARTAAAARMARPAAEDRVGVQSGAA